MWVCFLAAFNWDPPEYHGRITLFFPAGNRALVRKLCAEAAITRGVARLLETYEVLHERRRARA